MHVRVIPYLVQCMQYNFKNILIYIYKQVHKRKAVRWINVLGDIYIYLWIVMTHVLHKKKMIIHKLDWLYYTFLPVQPFVILAPINCTIKEITHPIQIASQG